MNKRILFTVNNDLNYDQRMHRICGTLADNGYDVTLVGHQFYSSSPLLPRNFNQKRIPLLFKKGKLFYIEYNIKLFCWLIFQKADILVAIDLDTIAPVYFSSVIFKKPRVYDAHELFTEMKEVVSRPHIHRFWTLVEKIFVPRFQHGYTVNQYIANIFREKYRVDYKVIRNMPVRQFGIDCLQKDDFLLYQGAVNEGRGLEFLIPAMQNIQLPLWIVGDGNFMEKAQALVKQLDLGDKVIFRGKLLPDDLKALTAKARIGFNLVEDKGLNNYYSLANRFFDYLHALTPQITMDYPAYRDLNKNGAVAVLLRDLQPETISRAVNELLSNSELYNELQQNCLVKREELHWKQEEGTLTEFYQKVAKSIA